MNENKSTAAVMNQKIECTLCPQHCKLGEGQIGLCKVRKGHNGIVISLNYGQIAASQLDPIEKKPLYHYYPGSWIFSVGSYGCNLRCFFCQNHEISQHLEQGYPVTPASLAVKAAEKPSLGICFTYSEPLMWYEMIAETAPIVKKHGGKVVLVSNGIIEEKYLEELLPYIDAVNIDIKGFTKQFYQKHVGGKLEWVLNTVEKLACKVHMEITTLVIPALNDDPEEIEGLAKWLSDLKVPLAWHLSRYFPNYKAEMPPTGEAEMRKLWSLARTHLPYVYLGNMTGGNITFCPHCGVEVIIRDSGKKVQMKTQESRCLSCGHKIWGEGLA